MPCLELPIPTLPTLGGGFTLGASLPSFSFDPQLCCKILPFPVVTPPIAIALPVGVMAGAIASLNLAITAVNAFHDGFVFNCPLE